MPSLVGSEMCIRDSLEAIPFARLTVECQAQWEKEKGQNARFRPRVALGFAGGQNDVDLSVSLDDDEE